ncbi:hypothetical protein FOS08_15315 [Bacillus pseudomycoides]|uniref:Uncharacterized protein n=1 Tax=Bacillus pseudomycoides TaxID=64104 RepID=A0AAJ1Z0V0_9BACI|nr:hypothetical protein [Bacillus pseudomycoides]
MTCTRFLSLFSLGIGQEDDLTASMHGRMLSPLKRKDLCRFFNLDLYTLFLFLNLDFRFLIEC